MLDLCEIFNLPNTKINLKLHLVRREREHAHAKVTWTTLILPKSKGGVGLIDLEDQSKTLLAKLIVRGKLLGTEIWKMLLKARGC